MSNSRQNLKKIIPAVLSIALSFFFIYAFTRAAGTVTTLGTNISTGGNLTVSGLASVGTSTKYSVLTVWSPGISSSIEAFSVVNNASSTLFNVLSNGSVGLGTTTPTTKLSIEMDSGPSFLVSNTGSSTPAFVIDSVNGNGRVGVGILSPEAQLDVTGSFRAGDRTNYGGFETDGDFILKGAADYLVDDNGYAFRSATDEDVGIYLNQANLSIDTLDINGLSVFNVNIDDGKVGIGTTSPYAKLSVVGQIVGSYFTSTSTTASTFPYASTTALSASGTIDAAKYTKSGKILESEYDCIVDDTAGGGDYTTINAAATAGCRKMYIKNGNYTLSADITVDNPDQPWWMIGESASSTVIDTNSYSIIFTDSNAFAFTGTISLAQGSTTVTGSGTTFVTQGAKPGMWFFPSNSTYGTPPLKIKSVDSETQITLHDSMPATSVSGSAFVITNAFENNVRFEKFSVTNSNVTKDNFVNFTNIIIGYDSPLIGMTMRNLRIYSFDIYPFYDASGGYWEIENNIFEATSNEEMYAPYGSRWIGNQGAMYITYPNQYFENNIFTDGTTDLNSDTMFINNKFLDSFRYGTGRLRVAETLPILNGDDTYRGLVVGLTNADHTGTNNYLYGMDIQGIAGDTQATETALRIGTGWDYGAIFESGNVGIGTTSPYAKLSVVGEIVGSYFTATSTSATSTFAGGFAVETNGLVYDYSTNRVGIGTASPGTTLQVAGSAVFGDSTNYGLFGNTGDLTFLGTADYLVGGNDYAFRYSGDEDSGLYFNLTNPGIDFTKLDGNIALKIKVDSGNVGVGTTSPYANLSVAGASLQAGDIFAISTSTASATTTVLKVDGNGKLTVKDLGTTADGFLCADANGLLYNGAATCAGSSKRWKSDIVPIGNALEKVLQMDGVYYTWDAAHGGRRDLGFIAEDLGKIVPEVVVWEQESAVSSASSTTERFAKTLDYGHLVALNTQAIKELNLKIENFMASTSSSTHLTQTESSGVDNSLLAAIGNAGEWLIEQLGKIGLSIVDGIISAKEFVADKITTKELCLEDVCIKKEQLKELLEKNGISGASPAPVIQEVAPVVENVATTTDTVLPTENASTTTETLPPGVASTAPEIVLPPVVEETSPVVETPASVPAENVIQ